MARKMDRREFHKLAGAAVGGLVAGASVLRAATANARPEDEKDAPLSDHAHEPGPRTGPGRCLQCDCKEYERSGIPDKCKCGHGVRNHSYTG
jgi:hypothetical protein